MTNKTKNKINNELELISFKNSKEFNDWLSKNYSSSNGIWLKFFKKDSNITSINHDEALDEALCYGWIDGQLKKLDMKSWLQKFTPRRPKSLWSKKNVERVEQLILEKRMKSAGLKEVNLAKDDGRWNKAYDSQKNMQAPEDFLKRLSRNPKANKFFETLNSANKYSIVWRLQTAKKPETRERRMLKILEMLSKGEKFH